MKLPTKTLKYLLKIVATDLQRMDANADHAASHGSEVYQPDHDSAAAAFDAITDELNDAG